jgi:hypothetical protein
MAPQELSKIEARRCSDNCPYEDKVAKISTDIEELKSIMLMLKGTLAFLKMIAIIGSGLAVTWAYFVGKPI